jgi:hypothetical protein
VKFNLVSGCIGEKDILIAQKSAVFVIFPLVLIEMKLITKQFLMSLDLGGWRVGGPKRIWIAEYRKFCFTQQRTRIPFDARRP